MILDKNICCDIAGKAASDVVRERARQFSPGGEGYTFEHDDSHDEGQLSRAASVYALLASLKFSAFDTLESIYRYWPFDWKFLKKYDARGVRKPPRRLLVKAGALILAEIERIDRAAYKNAMEEAMAKPDGKAKR